MLFLHEKKRDMMNDGKMLPVYKQGTHISACMLPTLPLRYLENLGCQDLPALTPIPIIILNVLRSVLRSGFVSPSATISFDGT